MLRSAGVHAAVARTPSAAALPANFISARRRLPPGSCASPVPCSFSSPGGSSGGGCHAVAMTSQEHDRRWPGVPEEGCTDSASHVGDGPRTVVDMDNRAESASS